MVRDRTPRPGTIHGIRGTEPIPMPGPTPPPGPLPPDPVPQPGPSPVPTRRATGRG